MLQAVNVTPIATCVLLLFVWMAQVISIEDKLQEQSNWLSENWGLVVKLPFGSPFFMPPS